MLIPSTKIKRDRKRGTAPAYQCPISGKRFEFHNSKGGAVARKAQQAYTSDLIVELDGDNASGIRRPILSYVNQYSRLHGPRTATAKNDVVVSVSAA